MFQELQDALVSILALSPKEIAIVAAVLICLYALAFALKSLVFYVYNRSNNEVVTELLSKCIYRLDEFADSMSNVEKRNVAIDYLRSLMSFKLFKLPRFIVGIIVDMQVAEIRKLQAKSTKETDLHK